ncbi:transmembrane protein 98 isoform X2 [Pteropus medius]|uniref:transmembrane protein 98 isoform X2 n=1 Tax=Pteropus vampyrus TaxID=132908 RepID=UPI00196B15E1|nr:transmembrane protein 98 isoform X2 [Pteropus giganteus]
MPRSPEPPGSPAPGLCHRQGAGRRSTAECILQTQPEVEKLKPREGRRLAQRDTSGRPAVKQHSSAHARDVTGTEGATRTMETVVIVAIGVLATIFLASFAALVVVCRQRYCRPRDLLQRYDSKPIVDLIGAMETQSEPSELELDDVVITNPHIEAILENEDWIEDASGLMSHCIAILKICHTLTEKLVAMTMGSGAKMKTSASVSDIIVVAKRISPRVDDVVKSMYPPLDPKLLDARTTALLLSVSHLVLVTRNACHLTGGLDWIDQSLSAAEEHLEVLREAALASEPEKGLPGPEGFLQEQSAI